MMLEAVGSVPVMSELELAWRFVNEPVLAVTGTSGKTTTVSLAAAMLEAAGKKVFLGGNIGTPLSRHVLRDEPADVLVLEVSSFQLQGSKSLHPRVAVLLNLTENHLDHHRDMAEYTEAKFRIFALQTEADTAVLPPDLRAAYEQRGLKAKAEYFTATNRFTETNLLGRHNAANAEAAWLACREFGVSFEDAARAVAAFTPLRHRLEPAATHNGVLYVNDSKCTTVEALRAALESFGGTGPGKILLIAGGKFKGGDLASLRPLLRERVRAVALAGASREVFEEAWKDTVPITWDAALEGAVKRLAGTARPGDAVLLSPATSSYDLYNNYKERGDDFCRIAREL
jgi:UDP-N-acetylmuramoylalanine--D-glutamate ligase